jgi:hypothetical protein
MSFLAALFAFLQTPVGSAAVAAIPGLVTELFTIGHQKGLVTAKDIADYLSTQEAFDTLVPKKDAPPVVLPPGAVPPVGPPTCPAGTHWVPMLLVPGGGACLPD